MTLSACSSNQEIELFNDKNLNGWGGVVDPAGGVPASEVFTVQDGYLRISGNPFGYIRTEREFTDYTLYAEWRWIGEPSNSGLFNRIQGPDRVCPFAVESNLMHGGVVHFVCLGGCMFDGAEPSGEFFLLKTKGDQASEKPAGEWNFSKVEV